MQSLFYSKRPSEYIWAKNRWVSGAFAQNFIYSTRFEAFFNTFGPTILSNVKHLRLCDLPLNAENRTAFAQALNSFDQLEELGLLGPDPCGGPFNLLVDELELDLPMLRSIYLERFDEVKKLTLDAPRLQRVRRVRCSFFLKLDLVHAESIETLITDRLEDIAEKHLKNLKHLYIGPRSEIDSTLLSDLEQLKEIHLSDRDSVSELFEQKRRNGRADLKVYLCGLLLNGPDVPSMLYSADMLDEAAFGHLAENPSRLADAIPFCGYLHYKAIECVAPELAINVLSRFTDLEDITVGRRVKDVERFLNFLKNSDHIVELSFSCSQLKKLFDRLPEHSAVQKLTIECAVPDFEFLFRLKKLVSLKVYHRIDLESVRRILNELKFLTYFAFDYANKTLIVETDQQRRFFIRGAGTMSNLPNPNAVIQWITRNHLKF